MELQIFVWGRAEDDRQHPQTAASRRAYICAEAERQDAERQAASDGPLWIPTKRAAQLLGIKPNSVSHWADRHHVTSQKVMGNRKYYKLSDVQAYAVRVGSAPELDAA